MSRKAIDLAGQRFGKLIVLGVAGERRGSRRNIIWFCRCDCGNERLVSTGDLRAGHTRSCGCLRLETVIRDLRSQRFGRLIVLERTEEKYDNGNIVWRCLCDCGKECCVMGNSLVCGDTRSCGCLQRETTAARCSRDLEGRRFGRLLVLKISEERVGGKVVWLCRCDCGTECLIRTNSLTSGRTQSCGCLSKELKHNRHGPKNPNWLGGISFEPYTADFNTQLKDYIRDRDNGVCQLCGEREKSGQKLSTHHIDYDKKNCEPNNFVSLCRSCHGKMHFNREYWRCYWQVYQGEKVGSYQ